METLAELVKSHGNGRQQSEFPLLGGAFAGAILGHIPTQGLQTVNQPIEKDKNIDVSIHIKEAVSQPQLDLI